MNETEIINLLKSMQNEHNRQGMARFGINIENAFGISMKQLYPIARKIKKNQELAEKLWETGFHEARLLAILIADPKKTTPELMDKWVQDFNSWDVCDQAAMKLFSRMPIAWEKVFAWAASESEFVRRAAFALIAALCIHYKERNEQYFEQSLELVVQYATDERNFVKKAVNWALRQIGKRSLSLNRKALAACEEILLVHPQSKAARWVAKNALRELTNEKTLQRVASSKFNQ